MLSTSNQVESKLYYFEKSLRKVEPYLFQFTVNTKGRWLKKSVLNMLIEEFQANDEAYYVC
jgi:hypothetical protein